MPNLSAVKSILACFFVVLSSSYSYAEFAVVIPKHSPAIDKIAAQLASGVPNRNGKVLFYDGLKKANTDQYDLIITIGSEAAEKVSSDASLNIPRLNAFCPRQYHVEGANRLIIFNDINLSIQINLIKKLHPNSIPRIGLLFSSNSLFLDDIDAAAARKDIVFITSEIKKGQRPEKHIDHFIDENNLDAFIVIPSAQLYDSYSLSSVFYSLYRNQVAAIVSSEELIDNGVGGAAAAIFDVDLVVAAIIDEIEYFYTFHHFSQSFTTPKTAKVFMNRKLSRSIGLDISGFKSGEIIHE